jgi:predicted RNase H-like HicB family nuclease
MMAAQYLVIYEKSADGWGAYVPDLPGLGVVGDSLEEVQRLIRQGIELHIQSLKEHGDPIPQPVAQSDYVRVDISLPA